MESDLWNLWGSGTQPHIKLNEVKVSDPRLPWRRSFICLLDWTRGAASWFLSAVRTTSRAVMLLPVCLSAHSFFPLSLSLSLSLYISSVNALTPWVVCVGNRWFLFIFIFWSLKRKFCINQFLTIKNIYILQNLITKLISNLIITFFIKINIIIYFKKLSVELYIF